METNQLEINFIQNQLNANNQIEAILQNEMTILLNLVHQKRQWLDQLQNNSKDLAFRLNSMSEKDKVLVKYYNEYE